MKKLTVPKLQRRLPPVKMARVGPKKISLNRKVAEQPKVGGAKDNAEAVRRGEATLRHSESIAARWPR